MAELMPQCHCPKEHISKVISPGSICFQHIVLLCHNDIFIFNTGVQWSVKTDPTFGEARKSSIRYNAALFTRMLTLFSVKNHPLMHDPFSIFIG
jgi:hypothetical protein